jgi:hypothetical protein
LQHSISSTGKTSTPPIVRLPLNHPQSTEQSP